MITTIIKTHIADIFIDSLFNKLINNFKISSIHNVAFLYNEVYPYRYALDLICIIENGNIILCIDPDTLYPNKLYGIDFKLIASQFDEVDIVYNVNINMNNSSHEIVNQCLALIDNNFIK
jgi:hypothetical protein